MPGDGLRRTHHTQAEADGFSFYDSLIATSVLKAGRRIGSLVIVNPLASEA